MKRQRIPFTQRVAAERRHGRSWFSAIFTSAWSSLGSWINTYDAVDPRNKAMRGTIARPASAADLVTSLPYVRNLCRNYERNNATVRAGVEGIVANAVGTGIALEPDTGDAEVDAKLAQAWKDYIRDCMIDGSSLYAGQTLGMRDVVVAGESLWRVVVDEERMRRDRIPLAVLPLEPEWLGQNGLALQGQSGTHIGGIDIDRFCRPVRYHLISPTGSVEAVPASMIIHAFEKRRALQVRGEPWFAPGLTTLHQEKDLITSELEAAKNTAGFAAAITTQGGFQSGTDEKGDPVHDIELGTVVTLGQGEDIKLLNHTRPSQQIAPFRKMLRGDLAGALRLGQRWLDRDVSGANYSSLRADMLDSERLLGPVREWFGHQTAGKLYRIVLPYLAIKAGVPMPKRDAYRLVADGQPYVDPLKDSEAAALAISYGLSTYEEECGKRGRDYREVWKKLAAEQEEMRALGLPIVTPQGMPMTAESDDIVEGGEGGSGYGANEPPRDKAGHFRGGKQNGRPRRFGRS